MTEDDRKWQKITENACKQLKTVVTAMTSVVTAMAIIVTAMASVVTAIIYLYL